jgi:predicted metal-dependent HD superfamily phosphohydrolase
VTVAILERVTLLDELFAEGAEVIGADLHAYRNHAYRVFNLTRAFVERPDASTNERIAIAAYFHDVGIWTDHTFDYLAPSTARALAWLTRTGRDGFSGEVSRMISEHHKLTPYHEPDGEIVEAFRRADWIDVTLGARRFGVDRAFVKEVRATFPNLGFHRRLVQLGLRRCRTHPLSPLPMLRF